MVTMSAPATAAPQPSQRKEASPAAGAAAAELAVAQTAAALKQADSVQERHRRAEEAVARAAAVESRAALLLTEAQETAAAKVAEAAEKVSTMLSRAAEGALQISTEAHAEGFREGREAGYAEGIEAARQEADSIRSQALAERAEILERSANEVVALALVVARHIVKAEISMKPESVLTMVEAALSRMKGEERPTVRLSPETLEVVQQFHGRLLQALPGAHSVDLVPDASLGDGDFVVQGEHGFVDGRVETQVESIDSALRKELE